MSDMPECIYIKLYPYGGRDGSEQLLIEIPYDRLHESYKSMVFATAYLAGRIPLEYDGCGNSAARYIHHQYDLCSMVEEAGQDRLFPLMQHRDFNTFFHIEIKWF